MLDMEKGIIMGANLYELDSNIIEWRDLNLGMQRYMEIIDDGQNENDIRNAQLSNSLRVLMERVRMKFNSVFHSDIQEAEVINGYNNGISISTFNKGVYPAIFVDELFEYSIVDFFMITFLWSEFPDDMNIWKYCFVRMLKLFHNQCIGGKTPKPELSMDLVSLICQKDDHILQQA